MSRYRTDLPTLLIFRLSAFLSGTTVLLIVAFLIVESIPALREIGLTRFFTDASWNPGEDKFGLAPMLWGTILVMAGAVILATPLGIISAVFSNYYVPPVISGIYRRLIELLAGIPSVVYGFWGLVVLVPLIRMIEPPGQSLLAGILILTLMILPTVALITDASFRNVPDEYIRGAAALGLSRITTVTNVVLPASKSGVFTGVVLSTGRALGETMAVLMVCGNIVQVPVSVFEPVRTLTANIALEISYATGMHSSALFVSGLILAALVLSLIALAEKVSRGRVYGEL